MSERKYEAKERTVKKMSRDGLLEESLRSGTKKRVSRREQEERSMREGEISTDAGLFRHSGETADGHRVLYTEKGDATGSELPVSPDSEKKRRRQRQRPERSRDHPAKQTDEGSPEGGSADGLRSFEEIGDSKQGRQRKQAGRYRNTEGRSEQRKTPQGLSAEDSGREGDEETEEKLTSEHSARMQGLRGRTAALSEMDDKSDTDKTFKRHEMNKKRIRKEAGEENVAATSQPARYSESGARHESVEVQGKEVARKGVAEKQRLSETMPDTGSLSERKEEIDLKRKKERYNQEQRKQRQVGEAAVKKGRLSFDDDGPDGAMVKGSGTGFGRKTAMKAAGAAALAAHAKIHEAEDENAGVEAAHSAELLAETSVRKASGSSLRQRKAKNGAARRKADHAGLHKLTFGEEPVKKVNAAKLEAEKKTTIRKFFQKQRYRRMYAAAKKEEKTIRQVFESSQNLAKKAAVVVQEAFRRNSGILIGLGILGVFCLLISASVTSCTAVIHGTGSSVVSTTYASTDEEIHKVEDAYEEMEKDLNDQINGIGNRYPEYNNFRYQIDEISHNPYHLISYFTAKYGEFTYAQVKDELEEIFRQQYGITTSGENGVTLTETKKVRVGESLGQVVTSGYCNCPLCCGQWSGGPTASGVYPTANHTIAVDAHNPFVPMGTHVVMNGVEYVVEDTGAFARYGVQFDVYYDSHSTAQAHGHKTWEAYLADSNGDREIEVTTTESVNRLSVTLTNHDLDTVLRDRMDANETKRYEVYNKTFGNRNYLFDLDKIPSYTVNGGYSIPPEALSDERFARMYNEAVKYLGVPYVWGGYSPSGFDCSGFVSWVINHCGNGWNYGRLTADGIRSVCAYVRPEDAKPGDIIFFQKTYNTTGASHVGIYLGDGKMIHCGKPCQITSLNSQYWTDHFLQYGRLP